MFNIVLLDSKTLFLRSHLLLRHDLFFRKGIENIIIKLKFHRKIMKRIEALTVNELM